ncbi:MAG TPA: PP0621 family protein [Casimicrobiaceae bacterium]|nr:PP0621 family protein [Casimicrobiaceae bacterium]
MGKIIFWLIVFFIALLVLRVINMASARSRGRERSARTAKKDPAMVRCVNCGIYLPRAEAVQGPKGPLCGDKQCLTDASGKPR